MNPRHPTQRDLDHWGSTARAVVYGADDEKCLPCPAVVVVDEGEMLISVAYELDEIELASLALGGTLWVTAFGHLPIHALHVQAKGKP